MTTDTDESRAFLSAERDAWCAACGGRGYVITCVDDLCANEDECMHGDGEQMCVECQGEGEIEA